MGYMEWHKDVYFFPTNWKGEEDTMMNMSKHGMSTSRGKMKALNPFYGKSKPP
jgi:hypothetical protein